LAAKDVIEGLWALTTRLLWSPNKQERPVAIGMRRTAIDDELNLALQQDPKIAWEKG
jgi:hypothetical protein